MTDILSWGAAVGQEVARQIAGDKKVKTAAVQSVNRAGDDAVEVVLRVERDSSKPLQESSCPSV